MIVGADATVVSSARTSCPSGACRCRRSVVTAAVAAGVATVVSHARVALLRRARAADRVITAAGGNSRGETHPESCSHFGAVNRTRAQACNNNRWPATGVAASGRTSARSVGSLGQLRRRGRPSTRRHAATARAMWHARGREQISSSFSGAATATPMRRRSAYVPYGNGTGSRGEQCRSRSAIRAGKVALALNRLEAGPQAARCDRRTQVSSWFACSLAIRAMTGAGRRIGRAHACRCGRGAGPPRPRRRRHARAPL